MDSGDFPFGTDFDSRSPREHSFHLNPISDSQVQPGTSSFAGPPLSFRDGAGGSNETYQPNVHAAHHENLQMIDVEIMEGPAAAAEAPAGLLEQDGRKSRRGKYTQLDWAAHKPHIQKLYFENKTLKQIKETMLKDHSFSASDKLYKNKFTEWGWQKNLPADTALFMVQKAKQRKRNSNKDTVFHFGGREWPLQKAETTLSRAKRQRGEEHMISQSNATSIFSHTEIDNRGRNAVIETPRGVTYETPAALVLSPEARQSSDDEDEEDHSHANLDTISEDQDSDSMLRLTWEGHTGPEFITLWKMALQCRDEGKADEAEDRLERAWNGLRHISGVTHEDTNKVAYSLASLYADTGHMDKAVALVERIIQDHVKTLGYKNRVTRQRILFAAEVLNGWNRHSEALGILARSKELLDKSEPSRSRRLPKTSKGRRAKGKEQATGANPDDEVSLLLADGFGNSDLRKVDWGLSVARRQVTARSESAEALLQAIIAHCEKHPEENLRQHIVARGELLALYMKLDVVDQHDGAFQDAMNALEKAWEHVDWDEDQIEHFEIMEASLQLIANVLKCGYQDKPQELFEEAVELANRAFGADDKRTIWILITIGIVYQTHMEWEDARDWFEQAFARALDAWGPDSKEGIVKSLQVALDREHFSYLSDEGRPYKTIFGVGGITVRPGRLHLE